jgi:hypothetical protein
MQGKKQDRLGELCKRALAESDPEQVLTLYQEINHILEHNILEVSKVIAREKERERSLESSLQ